MKMIAEYLEHARQFERWASQTDDATHVQQFLKQAAEYRQLAKERAAETGMTKLPTQSSRFNIEGR
jgi:hypothetical protein